MRISFSEVGAGLKERLIHLARKPEPPLQTPSTHATPPAHPVGLGLYSQARAGSALYALLAVAVVAAWTEVALRPHPAPAVAVEHRWRCTVGVDGVHRFRVSVHSCVNPDGRLAGPDVRVRRRVFTALSRAVDRHHPRQPARSPSAWIHLHLA